MRPIKTETIRVREAARMVPCGERAIRNGIEEGVIPHIRFGRNIRIPRSAFLRWIDSAGTSSK
jgi:excisionase family DNA binding protein